MARQLVKHQVGLVWNEVSRRYVDSKPQFYIPKDWRSKPIDKKQGSGEEIVELTHSEWTDISDLLFNSNETYNLLIRKGVAPEQARMLLPQSTYTEWYWTGSLYAFSRIYNLRLSKDAQAETSEIAQQISDLIQPKYPISWRYLVNV